MRSDRVGMVLLAALVATATDAIADERRHAVYVEVLGKGGAWGAGYDWAISPRLAIGTVASFAPLDGQRVYSLSPYLSVVPLGRGVHRWFIDVGPQLVHLSTPSPVPEWNGMSSSGIGAQASSGYERRGHVLLRFYGQVVAGRNGAAPWLGASLGWTL